MVRLGTKPLLLHVVEAVYQEYRFSATKSLPELFLCCHQGLQVTTVTLAPGSTRELLHEGWGSPCSPHKDVDATPLQDGGPLVLPASHQDSKDGQHTEYKLELLSSTAHKAHNLALSLKHELA